MPFAEAAMYFGGGTGEWYCMSTYLKMRTTIWRGKIAALHFKTHEQGEGKYLLSGEEMTNLRKTKKKRNQEMMEKGRGKIQPGRKGEEEKHLSVIHLSNKYILSSFWSQTSRIKTPPHSRSVGPGARHL